MGAGRWNGLKKVVTRMSANAIQNRPISSIPSKMKRNINVCGSRAFMHGENDALCAELWGFNDDYAEELLGGWWTDLKNNVAGATHKILNVGSKIPVADAAVERFRDITGVITGAKTGSDVATVAYDSRRKIILGGVALAIVIYLLTRDKKKR